MIWPVAARDTSREAHQAQCEAHRRLGAVRRVELAFEMSVDAREIAIAGADIESRGIKLTNKSIAAYEQPGS